MDKVKDKRNSKPHLIIKSKVESRNILSRNAKLQSRDSCYGGILWKRFGKVISKGKT